MLSSTFLNSLIGLPGFDLNRFVEVHESQEQVTSIRLNKYKSFVVDSHPFLRNGELIPWCNQGYYLPSRPSFVLDPLWHAGAYYVQEASSMFLHYALTQILPSPKDEKVLDLCAAPGGKSTLLANYFSKGLVVANEIIKSRNAILVENCTKWGADNVVVTQNDPVHFKMLPNFFDLMVIDAPCSGSGLFRKDPSAIAEWSLDSVEHCSMRQSRILEDSISALKEGGFLIYSTCSYSFAEDEKMMDFIAGMEGMRNIPLQVPGEWNIINCESPMHQAKGFRFYPDKIKGEGFFLAVFQKEKESAGYYSDEIKLLPANKNDIDIIQSHFQLPNNLQLVQHQGSILALSKYFLRELQAILKNLYVKKMGLTLGEVKGKDFIPSHALAMSTWALLPYGKIELDELNALQYLRRAHFECQGEKGWNVVMFQNIRLGWIKRLPNRLNNYYPNDWRILKY